MSQFTSGPDPRVGLGSISFWPNHSETDLYEVGLHLRTFLEYLKASCTATAFNASFVDCLNPWFAAFKFSESASEAAEETTCIAWQLEHR
eukprot:2767074-Amphidinium_carterae.1